MNSPFDEEDEVQRFWLGLIQVTVFVMAILMLVLVTDGDTVFRAP